MEPELPSTALFPPFFGLGAEETECWCDSSEGGGVEEGELGPLRRSGYEEELGVCGPEGSGVWGLV